MKKLFLLSTFVILTTTLSARENCLRTVTREASNTCQVKCREFSESIDAPSTFAGTDHYVQCSVSASDFAGPFWVSSESQKIDSNLANSKDPYDIATKIRLKAFLSSAVKGQAKKCGCKNF